MEIIIYGVPAQEDARILIEDDIGEKLQYFFSDDEAFVSFEDEWPADFAPDDEKMHILLAIKDYAGDWDSREVGDFYRSANNYFRRFFYDEDSDVYRVENIRLVREQELRV